MPADRLHLVRHGEVFNPTRVLYGRLAGFGLSDDGRDMARRAAEHVQRLDRPVRTLISSPLQRARESSEPFTELFGLEAVIDERVVEPMNVFEGKRMRRALLNPLNWRHLRDRDLPSWGEPYAHVVSRMRQAMNQAWDAAASGDVVIVSHQLPIWATHLSVAGERLRHDPRRRRCALSSVTSFVREEGTWREVAYAEPANLSGAVDVGAV
ncbi:histidine phosphatase family protein [Microbacterium sp. LRZ72]|uniref:histidine phosphatase family protein n=1 Tax=Microbacterium sp. LRZ72 TaxID=2942481 RepID=UPI0029AC2E81|nr:histidine phosphatase family protein [Microbacterium sp. LRZ72]MDX2376025.1 histidine phosphatase family protein [Microbacterium sp. LRZ72]